ncbi:unnamed protein product, partial [Amoebophrya sp. A25]|eukprot:GSA25T00003351001.1
MCFGCTFERLDGHTLQISPILLELAVVVVGLVRNPCRIAVQHVVE